MKYILQKPNSIDPLQTYPLWLVLHGAYDHAEQAIRMFGREALQHDAYLLAPQASRACGDGYCWSFAKDAADIKQLLHQTLEAENIDQARVSLMGFSMGCTIACWIVAQHPQLFSTFSSLSMGSAFEPWELDDGGIDLKGLAQAAKRTRVLLAVDKRDPYRCAEYFEANLQQFQALGFRIDALQPDQGVHDVTDEMKTAVFRLLTTVS